MENIKYVTEETYQVWIRRGALKEGDLILTREAPVGEVGILENSEGIFLGQRTVMYRAHSQKSNNLFLLYSLQSRFCQKQIDNFSNGGTVSHMRVPDCEKIIIKTPPLPEQRKIAQILSTWDKAIVTTEKLIAASKQQKKALMQQLLTGKKRFPGFEERFKRCHLAGLTLIDQNSLGKKTPENFEFKYISLSDTDAGKISEQLETHVFGTAPSRARRIVKEGDILLATVRPNLQGFAKIRKENCGSIASTGFAVLTPKTGVCGDYLYHYLFSAHISGQINALVVGSNYPAINSSDVAGLSIYCPDFEEQQKIASVLSVADREIATLEQKLDHLKQEKKALMQQLLTGKRRVKP